MAITLSRVPDSIYDSWRKNRVSSWDLDFAAATYTNGTGYTINASDVGLKFFRGIIEAGGNLASNNYIIVFNLGPVAGGSSDGVLPSSVNVRLYSAPGTELTTGTITAFTIRTLFYGG